eukprot:Gb_27274 [translate_table: standard]
MVFSVLIQNFATHVISICSARLRDRGFNEGAFMEVLFSCVRCAIIVIRSCQDFTLSLKMIHKFSNEAKDIWTQKHGNEIVDFEEKSFGHRSPMGASIQYSKPFMHSLYEIRRAMAKERFNQVLQAMKSIGLSTNTVTPILKRRIELYDSEWDLIEAKSYKVLADAMFTSQDEQEARSLERSNKTMGFGNYLEFLEKKLSQLPERIMRILTVHKYKISLVVAYIAEHQMLIFLSQAAWELNDDTTMTIEEIATLFHKQFPLISFELSDSHSIQEIVDCIRKYKEFYLQRNTMYSAALLARRNASDSSMLTPNISGSAQQWTFESKQNVGSFDHVTSVDVVECLLKALMLSDLNKWSH